MRVKQLISICKGWYRLLFGKRSELSRDRLSVCSICELRKGRFCGVCWCELDALSELTQDEGGICKDPKGSRWIYIDHFHKVHPLKEEVFKIEEK